MHLHALVSQHRRAFREKVVQMFADKHTMSREEVLARYSEVIERYVMNKYRGVERAISTIMSYNRPVVLSIIRDPCDENICRICERDKPNVALLKQLYGDRIAFYTLFDSAPEAAIYHIIHQGGGEKLLPLNAIIDADGEVIKYWSGRPVTVDEYREYLDPLCLGRNKIKEDGE